MPESYTGTALNLTAGTTYFLIIDSPDSTAGEFELVVELAQ